MTNDFALYSASVDFLPERKNPTAIATETSGFIDTLIPSVVPLHADYSAHPRMILEYQALRLVDAISNPLPRVHDEIAPPPQPLHVGTNRLMSSPCLTLYSRGRDYEER